MTRPLLEHERIGVSVDKKLDEMIAHQELEAPSFVTSNRRTLTPGVQ